MNIVHRTITDYRHRLGVVERIGDQGFQFWKSGGIVIADELVDQDNLIVNGGRERIRLGEEVVLRIILDGANIRFSLLWRYGLVLGDFLQAGAEGSGLSSKQRDVNLDLSQQKRNAALKRGKLSHTCKTGSSVFISRATLRTSSTPPNCIFSTFALVSSSSSSSSLTASPSTISSSSDAFVSSSDARSSSPSSSMSSWSVNCFFRRLPFAPPVCCAFSSSMKSRRFPSSSPESVSSKSCRSSSARVDILDGRGR